MLTISPPHGRIKQMLLFCIYYTVILCQTGLVKGKAHLISEARENRENSQFTSWADPIKIMPIGNSITQSDANHDSYRRPLWHRLKNAGYQVDFVGSQRDNHNGPPLHQDFDMDHEGHWGWRADQELEMMSEWVSQNRPDVVLLHLGTNDMFQNQSVSGTISEISQIIDKIRAANPQVKVLLAKVINCWNGDVNARIVELNNQIPVLAQQKSSAQSPIVVVDQNTGFSVVDDTFDGTHPNESGESKMADRWFEGLTEVLAITPPVPANQVPAVSLSAPTHNSSFTAPVTITLTANATDNDGHITKVEFYQGTAKIGEKTSAPWNYSWSNVGEGTYSLTAKAFDNAGASTSSSSVGIVVQAPQSTPPVNPPPVGTTTAGLDYRYYEGAWNAMRSRHLVP